NHFASVLERRVQSCEHRVVMGADASKRTHSSDPDKLILIPKDSKELRNSRLRCRTHAPQVQGRCRANPFVRILQHLGESTDGTLLHGAKVRQPPHSLPAERWIPVLQLLDPKACRLAPVKRFLLLLRRQRRPKYTR